MDPSANDVFRQLPSVNQVLESGQMALLIERYSRDLVRQTAREVLSQLRTQMKAGQLDAGGLAIAVKSLSERVETKVKLRLRHTLKRVINATGVILQTNLGRAPLSEQAIERIAEVTRGYSNLEFDLETGERSRRDVHGEDLILQLLNLKGQHGFSAPEPQRQEKAAALVNNCAAATFLALNTLAEGGEVIVSRGELVEIGGGFRIPEILAKSGAVLREVGTTNKTRVSDYAAAIGPATKLILKVHRSNFRIEGFTEQPSLEQLVNLGNQTSVPVFEDQGTGCVLDLAAAGLAGESSWTRSAASGAALVAASGDKLLGGPQCGILVGELQVVERIRANPLFRVLRVDKLTYAALQATLLAYITGTEDSLPVAKMIHAPAEQIRLRCEALVKSLPPRLIRAEVVPTRSVVGGGTTPGASLGSFAVALHVEGRSEHAVAAVLRALDTPVIGRVSDGRVLLDLRTVAPDDDGALSASLQSAFREPTRLEGEPVTLL